MKARLSKQHIDTIQLAKKKGDDADLFLLDLIYKIVKLAKGEKGDKGDAGPQGERGPSGLNGRDGRNGEDGYTPIKGVDYFNGKDGKDGETGPEGPAGKDGSPDKPQDIVAKLETLKGEARLDKSAIRGLDETIEKLDRRVQTPAKAYRIYLKDVSSQCDGVTKTFSVGGTHFGIVGVFSTQFPQIFRPIIDYTETRTGIALTSEVGAPQTGQSLVIQFLK